MQKSILILGLVVLSQAVFVKRASDPNSSVYAQLEALEDHPMGKKLLDTIALQIKNKSPLADIAKMLQDLRENLILQQQDAELVHAAQEVDCEAEIYGYNRRIEFASNEITEATSDIQRLSAEADLLATDISNKEAQLVILNEQEEALREKRAEDNEAFKQRQVQTPIVIDALDVIASKLSAIQPEGDAEAVLAELHRIGGENPILALVSIASTFSADTLNNVQSKIAELRASLEQALIDDQEAEIQAQLNFEQALSDFAEQRQGLQIGKLESENKLVSVNNQLGSAKKRRYDAGRELDSATQGKIKKEAECDAWRTQYANDTEQRTVEIKIIRQVEEILATKLEGASGYLKSRIQ